LIFLAGLAGCVHSPFPVLSEADGIVETAFAGSFKMKFADGSNLKPGNKSELPADFEVFVKAKSYLILLKIAILSI